METNIYTMTSEELYKQGYLSKEDFEREIKIKMQEKYCDEHHVPNFADGGRCYHCYRNVFDYFTVEQSGNHHITGCPYCNHSFCE